MDRRRSSLIGAAMVLAFFAVIPAEAGKKGSAQGGETTFRGRATAVRAEVLGITTMLADTGPLPPSGGAFEASLLEADVPGLVSAEVLHASTVGQGDRTTSEASVARLRLTVAGNLIEAKFLMARAEAICLRGKASVSGSSEIADLTINGDAVGVSGQPNQTIEFPGGTIILNEQLASDDEIRARDSRRSRRCGDFLGSGGHHLWRRSGLRRERRFRDLRRMDHQNSLWSPRQLWGGGRSEEERGPLGPPPLHRSRNLLQGGRRGRHFVHGSEYHHSTGRRNCADQWQSGHLSGDPHRQWGARAR